tara:strand:+ start:292 stop:465 length:174 start_codon:yes stop_codon:yes gene_type:complete
VGVEDPKGAAAAAAVVHLASVRPVEIVKVAVASVGPVVVKIDALAVQLPTVLTNRLS